MDRDEIATLAAFVDGNLGTMQADRAAHLLAHLAHPIQSDQRTFRSTDSMFLRRKFMTTERYLRFGFRLSEWKLEEGYADAIDIRRALWEWARCGNALVANDFSEVSDRMIAAAPAHIRLLALQWHVISLGCASTIAHDVDRIIKKLDAGVRVFDGAAAERIHP